MIIIFEDQGWPMVSSNWTFGQPPTQAETRISYVWGAEGKTASYMVTIPRGLGDVLDHMREHARDGVCDLRPLQGGPVEARPF